LWCSCVSRCRLPAIGVNTLPGLRLWPRSR
jgi:hypothetical protein